MSNTDEKLVRMANQIASFFKTQPGDKATASTAQHIKDFWDPSMIAQMRNLLANDVEGLDPIAHAAAKEVTAA